MRFLARLPMPLIVVFMMQAAIHKGYVNYTRFNPAADRCDKMHGDLAASTIVPRGRCLDEMLAAMDEGNDFFWFLK